MIMNRQTQIRRIHRSTLALPVFLIATVTLFTPSAMSLQGYGLPVNAFRSLANSLPQMAGAIEAIRIFYEPKNSGNPSVAFATYDTQNGWQLSIFREESNRKFQREWQSGQLEESFKVSYPAALKVFDLGNGQTILFEGCAPHACPDVFSILLFAPNRKTAFTANCVWGKITYSSNLKLPQDSSYKAILGQLIKNHSSR